MPKKKASAKPLSELQTAGSKPVSPVAKELAANIAKTKGKKPSQYPKRHEGAQPSARDLAWYRDWSVNFKRKFQIAADANVTRSTVSRAIDKVDAWLKQEMIDDVLAQRVRQTEFLEQVAADCAKQWQTSQDVAFAEQARKILSDIRKMWGMDKPQSINITSSEGEGLERVAGLSRSEAIRQEAAKMLAAASAVDGESS